ncbi:DNA primase [Marinicella sp. W31]|uniref:DNA primase n=1 Tax=Marinicella sp. W31 TaxID=3023713 RepID=UPI0037569112
MSGSIPNEFIDQLLDRTDIYDIVSARVNLKKSGKDFSGLCPFHAENTPSFTVSQQKQFYHCFGCGKHGSAIGFMMDYEGLDFVDAVTELAQKVGLEVPQTGGPRLDSGKNLYEITEKASRIFKNNLKKSEATIKYLKNRGINGETAQLFQLGYAQNAWDGIAKQFAPEQQSLLLKVGLTVSNDSGREYDKFRDRLIFPIHDRRGRVIAFGGRALQADQKPKYLNSPETPLFHKGRELYAYHIARKHSRDPRILVVEGYMDVIALHQHGIMNAVATLGTATSEQHVTQMFRAWDEIVFCFDGDRAGRDAAGKALLTALKLYRDDKQISFLFLPDNHDPDSYVCEHGKDAFEQLLDTTIPLSKFLLRTASQGLDINTLDGRARFHDKASQLVAQIPTGTFRKMLVDKISQLTHVEAQLPPQPEAKIIFDEKNLTPAKKLLSILLQHPGSVEHIPEDIPWHYIKDKRIEFIQKVIEICRQNPHITTAAALENFRGTEYFDRLGPITQHLKPLSVEQKILELQDIVAYFQEKIRQYRIRQLREQQLAEGLTPEQKQELVALLAQQIN